MARPHKLQSDGGLNMALTRQTLAMFKVVDLTETELRY